MSKTTSIKEYGDDLLKQHRDLETKQTTLRNKVVKRFKFLHKNSDSPYIIGFDIERLEDYNVEMLIFVIKRVEEAYVAQSVQTDLFTPIPRYLNMRFDENNKKIGDCTLCKEQFVLISEHKCGEETKK